MKWKEDIYPYLDETVKKAIDKLPTSNASRISEIRLRVSGAVSVTIGEQNKILFSTDKKPLTVSENQMQELFTRICDGTVYKYEDMIRSGYITVRGGHRVGFCGTAVYDGDRIRTIDAVTSITFRISRQIQNAAREVIGSVINDGKVCSCLIVSEPGGGKTTVLTDLSKTLSRLGKRCAVVDERSEICSVFSGVPQKDIGELTDVLTGYRKGDGMMSALRCLSPQVIICDEIGSKSDVDAMLEAMNAGVPVIATAHASCEDELLGRPQIERLIDSGAIDKLIFLRGCDEPGAVRKVVTVNNYDQNYWSSDDDD